MKDCNCGSQDGPEHKPHAAVDISAAIITEFGERIKIHLTWNSFDFFRFCSIIGASRMGSARQGA